MKRLVSLMLLSILLVSCLIGGNIVQAYSTEVIDDLGRKVLIDEKPSRIISLAPSHTEILFALGLRDKVVGVTTYADYPEAATKVDKIGTIKEPNVERIIQLNPDLVVAAGITSKDVIERLSQLGINVIGLNPKKVDEIIKSISLVGKATGQLKEANKLTTKMKNKVKGITSVIEQNVAESERPEVFYEIWSEPLYTAGPNTFIDDLIYLAGGINIAHDAQGMWPQYNFEVLLAKNPDVYLSSKHSTSHGVSKESIMKRERFKNIKAIKEGRVFVLNPNIVNRGGPRIITALEQIAKAIHPELF